MKFDFNNHNSQSHYTLLPIKARDDKNITLQRKVWLLNHLFVVCVTGIGTAMLISDFWEEKDGVYIGCLSLLHLKF